MDGQRSTKQLNMKTIIYTALMVSVAFLTSCYYDKEELLYPENKCDTTNITYTNTIASIISNNACYTCHSGNQPFAGFSLEGYANVKAKVTDGRLLGAISHSPGFAPMPQGMNMLTQ